MDMERIEQTMSDDLIKRSDAIEAIEMVDWYHQASRNKDMVNGANPAEHQAWYKADDIYKALEAVPSADRPSGKWIRHENPRYSYDREQGDINAGAYYTCSECNCISLTHKYCHNCGAKMDGERREP